MADESDTEPSEPKSETPSSNGKERTERSETPYPFFGLGYAIDVLQAVRRAGGTEAASAFVMRELGVAKTTERKWAYGIPAAAHFGLIERVGRGEAGRIRLTELGRRVALPGTDEEARAARVAAFKTPELYVKLLERFGGAQVPTKEGLRNVLQRDYKIVESMAPVAADAFLDSLKEAGLITANNTILTESARGPSEVVAAGPAAVDPASVPGTQAVIVPADFVVYKCKIGGGRVINIPLPPKFTKADVTRLTAFLETQVDDEATVAAK